MLETSVVLGGVNMPKICCVVPSIRPSQMVAFREAWSELFRRHKILLVIVWDGDNPQLEVHDYDPETTLGVARYDWLDVPGVRDNRDLFCRRTDGVRNVGFVLAAQWGIDFFFTADDDVAPVTDDEYRERLCDPIAAHLDALSRRVPLSWMNTAHTGAEYLRGVPYGVRDEAPVMLSHGVWVGTPDFDGETQLRLEKTGGVPKTLPYYVGPVPRGVLFPLCGMNVMVRKEALPYLYFAPMGADSGFPDLHRFADIWMGIHLKQQFDKLGWACYTGTSTVLHARASDAKKNFEQERLGREWNEHMDNPFDHLNDDHPKEMGRYQRFYFGKALRYADLIRKLQG